MNNSIRFFKSKDDFVYNVENFGKKYNLLFITGLVGSGKSTLAKKIAKEKKAIILEQDYLYGFNIPENDKVIKRILSGFYKSFPFAKEVIEKDLWKKKAINLEQDIELKRKYNDYLISYAMNNKDKLFIIEGVDVFKIIKAKEIKRRGIIIKRTSSFDCFCRRIKRDGLNKIFLILFESKCYYIDNLKNINKYIRSLISYFHN